VKRSFASCEPDSAPRNPMSVENHISCTKEYPLGIITFTHPEKLNSFTTTKFKYLHKLLLDLDKDPEVKIVILTGVGRYFSSGADFQNGFNPKTAKKDLHDGIPYSNHFIIITFWN
jgi:enoyl-CoA hydratase/carnithine racemase